VRVEQEITIKVDGTEHRLTVDTRTTLLDALRERLGISSPKKGCDHGQCGACTVLLAGRRINSCLALAVAFQDEEIVTAEGLAEDGGLHPVQRSFIEHHDFAEYHIPTNTDVGEIDISWIDEEDPYVNPMGSKGIGEIGIVGSPAAVYHATGVRVRDLPITPDKLGR